MTVRRFRCPLPEIGYVRMIVEAYDGLAVVMTPGGQGSGVLEWWIAPGREEEANGLARRLAAEARLRPLEGAA